MWPVGNLIRGNPLLLALLAFSVASRAYGILWGVTLWPLDVSVYHPDEPQIIDQAFNFPDDILERTDFRYPTGHGYLIAILGWPFVKIAGALEMDVYLVTYMIGRLISVLMGTASVGLTYLIGKSIYGHRVGLLSAALLAVSTMHVANSAWATLDVPSSFWLVLFCWLLVRTSSCLHHWRLLGVTLGVLTGTKYTGGIAVIVLIVAVVGELRRKNSPVKVVGRSAIANRLWAIGGIAVSVFFLSTPAIFVQPDMFLQSIAFLSAQFTFYPLLLNLLKIADALGTTVAVATVIGMAGCFAFASGRKLRPYAIAVAIFILSCVIVPNTPPRYIILIAPLCALLAGYAVVQACLLVRKRGGGGGGGGGMIIGFCILVFGYNGIHTLRTVAARYPDSRPLAEGYISEQVPDGATIGFMYESDDVPYPLYEWRYPQVDLERVVYTDFLQSPEYIVVSEYAVGEVKKILNSAVLNEDYKGPPGLRVGFWRLNPSSRIFEFADQLYFSEDSPYRRTREFRTLHGHNRSLEFPSPTIEVFRRKAGASDYVARLIGDSWPIIRSGYDVYLIENSLIYVKESCRKDDIQAGFFLHAIPVDATGLPDRYKQYGYDNLDFDFRDHSLSARNICVARRELPDYDLAAIRTGQYLRVEGGFDNIWEGSINVTEQAGDKKAAPP